MKYIDISWPMSQEMTEYKDRNTVQFKPVKEFQKDGVRETVISMNVHTGTHIDAPSHFLQDGVTIDQVSLSHFIGPCRVLDCTHSDQKITIEDLDVHDIKPDEIILLKTKNSFLAIQGKFEPSFVYLDKSTANFLAERRIKTVGIDYLGIERKQPEHETHITLLENNIGIIEGLRLAQVQPGEYMLYCLPLLLMGVDAAPARAVLVV